MGNESTQESCYNYGVIDSEQKELDYKSIDLNNLHQVCYMEFKQCKGIKEFCDMQWQTCMEVADDFTRHRKAGIEECTGLHALCDGTKEECDAERKLCLANYQDFND